MATLKQGQDYSLNLPDSNSHLVIRYVKQTVSSTHEGTLHTSNTRKVDIIPPPTQVKLDGLTQQYNNLRTDYWAVSKQVSNADEPHRSRLKRTLKDLEKDMEKMYQEIEQLRNNPDLPDKV